MMKLLKLIFTLSFFKNIKVIVINLTLIFLIGFLYEDIIQYMVINNFHSQIIFILIIKWTVFLIPSYFIYKNIKLIFNNNKIKLFFAKLAKEPINPKLKEKSNELFEQIKDKEILENKSDAIDRKMEELKLQRELKEKNNDK